MSWDIASVNQDQNPSGGPSPGARGGGDLVAAVREVLAGADLPDAAERHGVSRARLEEWHARAVELALDALAVPQAVAAVPATPPEALVDHLLQENERLWDLVLDGAPR